MSQCRVSSRRRIVGVSLAPHCTGMRLRPFGRDPIPVCAGLLRFSLFEAVKKTVFYQTRALRVCPSRAIYRSPIICDDVCCAFIGLVSATGRNVCCILPSWSDFFCAVGVMFFFLCALCVVLFGAYFVPFVCDELLKSFFFVPFFFIFDPYFVLFRPI